MTDGLDVLTVQIEHEGAEVVLVIVWPKAWGAVVAAAGFHGRVVEGADGFSGVGFEGEMNAAFDRLAGSDPELGLAFCTEAGLTFAARLFRRDFDHQLVAEGLEDLGIEHFGALVVRDRYSNVIKHLGEVPRKPFYGLRSSPLLQFERIVRVRSRLTRQAHAIDRDFDLAVGAASGMNFERLLQGFATLDDIIQRGFEHGALNFAGAQTRWVAGEKNSPRLDGRVSVKQSVREL